MATRVWLWLLPAALGLNAGCDTLGALSGASDSKESKSSKDSADDDTDDEAPKKSKKSKKRSKSDDDGESEKGASAAKPGSKDAREFPTPTSFNAPPIVPGSFSRMRNVKEGAPDGDTVVKVLSQSGDQVRVEIEAGGPQGPVIVQGLVRVRDRTRVSGLDILEAKLKTGAGPVMSLTGAQLGPAQKMLQSQLDIFQYPDATIEKRREDVTVPAGTFRGCMVYDREGTIPMLGMKTKIRTWVHPAVPTNGVVKSESVIDGKTTIAELVEFASSGATAKL